VKGGENGLDDFEIIYRKYYHYVKQYAVSLCFDELLAEEITQEAFIRALENYETFRGDCRVESWICSIARNVFLSMKRKKREESMDGCLSLASNFSVAGETEDSDSAKRILTALVSLESPYKDVFYMRAIGEMPFEVIAELFSKSESWARVTYHRAKLQIQERLGKDNE